MVQFIDDHRATYGVEPICAVLPIAPSTYFRVRAQQQDATKRPARATRDDAWRVLIQRVYDKNFGVYGPRKVWRQLRREGHDVARCTVERLMRAMGLAGAVRGRAWKITTQSQPALDRPADLVDRSFVATRPNQLWVSDFTYVATWAGFVYVAFVIDVFARRIVGWRVSSSMRTDFVLDALEQAIWARGGAMPAGLVHHSDQGTQYSVDGVHGPPGGGGHCAVGGQSRRRVRQRVGRVGDWALQDGGDSAIGSVAEFRQRGIRDADLDRLVQHAAVARANRIRAAGGIRSALL